MVYYDIFNRVRTRVSKTDTGHLLGFSTLCRKLCPPPKAGCHCSVFYNDLETSPSQSHACSTYVDFLSTITSEEQHRTLAKASFWHVKASRLLSLAKQFISVQYRPCIRSFFWYDFQFFINDLRRFQDTAFQLRP